jgi:thiol-disulfide isomerase/thioredoxin
MMRHEKYRKALGLIAVGFFSILLSHAVIASQGYEIKIKVNGLKDARLILGHHFNNQMFPNDTIMLDSKGTGVFKSNKALPGGMYLVFLPSSSYFDLLISDNQKFSIEVDTSNFLNTIKFVESAENQLFYEYQRFMVKKREEINPLVEQRKAETDPARLEQVNQQIERINQEVKNRTWEIINGNPGMFLSTFLKATQEIEVPEPPRDAEGNIIDSLFQYKYYRAHYFDNFDISDSRLLRTPLYENKIKLYIEKVIPQIPDSIVPEVDWLLEKASGNDELFRFMLVSLYNHYAQSQIMGMDAVFVHLAENYYIPRATWSSPDFIEKIKTQVARRKPNLLGKVAPDITLVRLSTDHFIQSIELPELKKDVYAGELFTLHSFQSPYTVLLFWEPDCGHCKKVAPDLHELLKKFPSNQVQVIAIQIVASEEGKVKWIDFVNDKQLFDWTNAWSPYSYEYKDNYDIFSTPVIYLLDANKKILAKRIGTEQLEEILNFELKKGKG